jgi:hypothetical protein
MMPKLQNKTKTFEEVISVNTKQRCFKNRSDLKRLKKIKNSKIVYMELKAFESND